MDTVLMAVRPEWVSYILAGLKTIEVRKNRPRELPFRVLIYCNKWGKTVDVEGRRVNGTVCAEAVVTDCFRFSAFVKDGMYRYGVPTNLRQQSMVSEEQMASYAQGRDVWLWQMEGIKMIDAGIDDFGVDRVPRSWCYAGGGDKNE